MGITLQQGAPFLTARFELNISPFSVNAMYCRDKRYKSQAYKQWEMRFIVQLRKKTAQAQIQKIREAYRPGDKFAVKLTCYYYRFLNKQGLISAHTEDLSNVEKPILDILFLSKYHVLPEPYGAPNINADDRFIVSLTSRKLQAKDPEDKICIAIRLIKAVQATKE